MDNSAAATLGASAYDAGSSQDFGNGWWDANGGDVIAGIGSTLGGLFQSLPGIIAASNGQQGSQAPFIYGQPQPAAAPAPQQQNTLMYIIIVVVILLLVVGGIYLFTRKTAA